MKRMILLVLILLVFTVSCAYKPEGKPVLVVENFTWAKNPSNNGAINVYCTVKNIGTSDNTMLKDGYSWNASSFTFKVVFTNGFIMTTNSWGGYLGILGRLPNINQSLPTSNFINITFNSEIAIYTNSYYTNANFIEKIEPRWLPQVELSEPPSILGFLLIPILGGV